MEATDQKPTKNRRNNKYYCSAFGCMSSSRNSNLKFFQLPKNAERRQRWLIAIDREELAKKENFKPSSYVVCSLHFKKSDTKTVTLLRDDAIPSKCIVEEEEEEEEEETSREVETTYREEESKEETSQTPRNKLKNNNVNPETLCKETQTNISFHSHEETQTEVYLTDRTPRKRKLAGEVTIENDNEVKKVAYYVDVKEEKNVDT